MHCIISVFIATHHLSISVYYDSLRGALKKVRIPTIMSQKTGALFVQKDFIVFMEYYTRCP